MEYLFFLSFFSTAIEVAARDRCSKYNYDYGYYYYKYCSGYCGGIYGSQYCKSSFTSGSIAGLVIGLLFTAGIIFGVVFCCMKAKNRRFQNGRWGHPGRSPGGIISTGTTVAVTTTHAGYSHPPQGYPAAPPPYGYPPAQPTAAAYPPTSFSQPFPGQKAAPLAPQYGYNGAQYNSSFNNPAFNPMPAAHI